MEKIAGVCSWLSIVVSPTLIAQEKGLLAQYEVEMMTRKGKGDVDTLHQGVAIQQKKKEAEIFRPYKPKAEMTETGREENLQKTSA